MLSVCMVMYIIREWEKINVTVKVLAMFCFYLIWFWLGNFLYKTTLGTKFLNNNAINQSTFQLPEIIYIFLY